ncbi:transglycosylase SLT domain-containing protein [Saccharopolyspora erythraea]|uniref:transglycosylase SLT domain-containing protein n=1 Tax=Saccharopolyspora erythraea TaxID=1836 RepID=UPI002010FED8|nr:transglycosylase SLT domain-containing protein [Saccharopolyspora erythraea]
MRHHDDAGNGRLSPRMRSVQVGAVVAAAGVLGVLGGIGQPGEPEHVAHVSQAAETAPLQAPAPAPVEAPAPAPVEAAPAAAVQAAPAGARAPVQERGAEADPQQRSAPAAPAPAPADPPKDQLDGWIKEAVAVLEASGTPKDKIDVEDIRTIIEHESGGDPDIVNNWDSNAAMGTPSKGLMQTIEPTFESYALPGHGDILDPVDNIIAGVRYSVDRYGSVSDVPGVVKVDSGGSYRGY